MQGRWLAILLVVFLSQAPGWGLAPAFLGRPLAAWVEDLGQADARVRRSGAFALGRMGPAAVGARPQLLRALADKDAGVRETAAWAVGEIGALAEDVLSGLLNLLARDPDAGVRRSAAGALGSLQAPAVAAGPALEKALQDSNPAVRQMAAWALGQVQPLATAASLDGLQKALADADPLVRRDAVASLGEIARRSRGEDGDLKQTREPIRKSRHAVLACFKKDPELAVRKAALNALVNLVGPDDSDAAEDLRQAITDTDLETARAAALALANIGGPRAARAVPVLAEMVAEGDPAALALATAGLMNLFPGLNQAQRDTDLAIRQDAQQALRPDGPLFARALPAWIKALDPSQSDEIRLRAAVALHPVAFFAKDGLPTFLDVLKKDRNIEVRQRMVPVLRPYADRAEVRAGLEAALEGTGRETVMLRYEAAEALAERLGEKTPTRAVEVLVEFLNDPAIQLVKVQTDISSAGTETQGGARVAVQALGDARAVAAQALGKVGSRANRPEVIASLQKATRAADEGLRKAALEALARIQKPE